MRPISGNGEAEGSGAGVTGNRSQPEHYRRSQRDEVHQSSSYVRGDGVPYRASAAGSAGAAGVR